MKHRRRTGTKSWPTVMIVLLFLVSGLSTLGMAVADGTDDENTDTNEPNGPEFPEIAVNKHTITGRLGGGDFIGIYNQDRDAMIGVLYGTGSNPNNIHIVSMYTRFLGAADVYSANGLLIRSDQPIPVKTLFAQRLGQLYEFDDLNGDGIFDSRRMAGSGGNGSSTSGSSDPPLVEPVFKRVNLWTSWEASEVVSEIHENGSRSWAFSLTARNLTYHVPLGPWVANAQNKLEEVTFTFHLWATRQNVTASEVPVYKVTVKQNQFGGVNVVDSEYQGTRSYSGQRVRAQFKYDHLINGWDFAPGNQNKSLLLGTQLIMTNVAGPLTAQWMNEQFWQHIGGSGTVEYEDDDGSQQVNETEVGSEVESGDSELSEDVSRPHLIRKNQLQFNDNWQRVARFTWVSNVTVDGQEDEMAFQIYGAKRYQGFTWGQGVFRGIAVHGGFAYPGGASIYHDPAISSDALTLNIGAEADSETIPLFKRPGVILIMAIVIVIVVVLLVFLFTRSKGNRPQQVVNHDQDMDRSIPQRSKDESYMDGYYWDRGR